MRKEYRVKRNEEIEAIIKHKNFYSNKYFVVYKKENNETSHVRYALSVGKKIGNAVLRNKVKRQIRSVVDSILDINQNFDVFIVVKSSILSIEYEQKIKQIIFLFNKLNIKNKGA